MKKFLLSLAFLPAFLMGSATQKVDELTATSFNLSGTSYAYYTCTGTSGAEYAAVASSSNGIQMNNKTASVDVNNDGTKETVRHGIITTTSPGKLVSIAIEYNTAKPVELLIQGSAFVNGIQALPKTTTTSFTQEGKAYTFNTGATSYDHTSVNANDYFSLIATNGAAQITKITVTWDVDDTPEGLGDITITPEPGTYYSGQQVTISCPGANYLAYLDGASSGIGGFNLLSEADDVTAALEVIGCTVVEGSSVTLTLNANTRPEIALAGIYAFKALTFDDYENNVKEWRAEDEGYEDGANFSVYVPVAVEANVASGSTVEYGTEVTLSCANAQKIVYQINDENEVTVNGATATIALTADATIIAYGVFGDVDSTPVELTYTVTAPTYLSDTLTVTDLTAKSTTYTLFSNVTKVSPAVYAGQSANDTDQIVLRSGTSKNDTQHSGIITTANGDYVLNSVSVKWGSKVADGRTLDIYGSNAPYSDANDLYASATQGDRIGSITYTNSEEYTTTLARSSFEGDYKYVAVRSNNGALYLESITFNWDSAAAAPEVDNAEFSLVNGDFEYIDEVRLGLDDVDANGKVTFSYESWNTETFYLGAGLYAGELPVSYNIYGAAATLENGVAANLVVYYDAVEDEAVNEDACLQLPAAANGKAVTFVYDTVNQTLTATWVEEAPVAAYAYMFETLPNEGEGISIFAASYIVDEEYAEWNEYFKDGTVSNTVVWKGDACSFTIMTFATIEDMFGGMMVGAPVPSSTVNYGVFGGDLANGVPAQLIPQTDPNYIFIALPEEANGKEVEFTYNRENNTLTATWTPDPEVIAYIYNIVDTLNEAASLTEGSVPYCLSEELAEMNDAYWTNNVTEFVAENWSGTYFHLEMVSTPSFSSEDPNNKVYYYGNENNILANGVAIELSLDEDGLGGNMFLSLPASAEGKDVTFTYNREYQTLTATWEETPAGPEVTKDPNCYIPAGEEGWNVIFANYAPESYWEVLCDEEDYLTFYFKPTVPNAAPNFVYVQTTNEWLNELTNVSEGTNYCYCKKSERKYSDYKGQTITFIIQCAVDGGRSETKPINYLVKNGLTGVENVIVNANDDVEYYNLQGVRVINPAGGIFIQRQGNKVTKVVK